MRLPHRIDDFFRRRKPTPVLASQEMPTFERQRLPELRGGAIQFGPVKLLSTDPPIFLSGIAYDEFLGVARSFGQRYGNVKAGFIIFPTWSIENAAKAEAIRHSSLLHNQRYPEHKLRYICNTVEEARMLECFEQRAVFLNHKFTVSEQIFRPLPHVPVEFDAIYNARFVLEKRHALAEGIDRVAYVAYTEPQETRQQDFRALWSKTKARCPGHVLLNELVDGLPVTLSHEEVNLALARADTGLILSAVEGASYAAMEYMLAGLPVVSTPSVGGRHVFFDPEYTIICEPDPRSVRDAVAALKQRGISRQYVREKTLQKIQPERRRFLAMIDDLTEELVGKPRFSDDDWPFGTESGVPWASFTKHLADFEKTQTEFGKRSSVWMPMKSGPVSLGMVASLKQDDNIRNLI